MGLKELFIDYRKPEKFCFIGEDQIDFFQVRQNSARLLFSIGECGLRELSSSVVARAASCLKRGEDWGIVVGSGSFVFNNFEFDRLPWQRKKYRDIVEWRLKKVFPDELGNYDHACFRLNSKRALSVLFRVSDRMRVEKSFSDNGVHVSYFGNSTVELMNAFWSRLFPPASKGPDFLIEIDGPLAVVVFQTGGLPYYIRKFYCETYQELESELSKTFEYVKTNFRPVLQTAGISGIHDSFDMKPLFDFMRRHEIQVPEKFRRSGMFIPGVK